MTVVLAEDDALADNAVATVAARLELEEVQLNRHHERDRGWKGERFPEPVGYPGLMGLLQLEGYPEPLATDRQTAFVLAMPASLETAYPAGPPYALQFRVPEHEC